jgi:hypothetical protein
VLALVSAIRPIVGRIIRPAFALPNANHDDQQKHDDGGGHEHSDEGGHHEHAGAPHGPGKSDAPVIVYVLEGPDSPQRFLAPCYVDPAILEDPERSRSASGGHEHGHGNLLPACDHTLMPRLIVEQGESGARVRVVLHGDRGAVVTPATNADYRLMWAVATQDEFVEGEYFEDDAAVLELPAPAIYHVELTLEHVPTEAIVTTYDYIPVPGKQELPSQTNRDGQRRVS